MTNLKSAYLNPVIDCDLGVVRWMVFLTIFTALAIALPYMPSIRHSRDGAAADALCRDTRRNCDGPKRRNRCGTREPGFELFTFRDAAGRFAVADDHRTCRIRHRCKSVREKIQDATRSLANYCDDCGKIGLYPVCQPDFA